MELVDRVGLLCMIIDGGQNHIVEGRTALQKISYFCNRYLDWDVGRYRLHYYGPFSFDLTNTIQVAESIDLVSQGSDAPHKFELTDNGRDVMKKFTENVCDRTRVQNTRRLVRYLSNWTKKDLELVATIDFVHVNTPGIQKEDIIEKVHIIKNAFAKDDIQTAYEKWIQLKDSITQYTQQS